MRLANPMCLVLLVCCFTFNGLSANAELTPGNLHNFTHEAGTVPKDTYQYSIYIPQDYNAKRQYPVVFYLHGGGRGRHHPDQGKHNMVSDRLRDNKRQTDAGYSKNVPGYFGYILVSPVKPIARWNAERFGRLYSHVTNQVNVDVNRVYVTGFSMGGQGTWRVACGNPGSYKIAAMMPLGAWGCNEVRRGDSPESCKTIKTAVWVLHCPNDPVSKISEQIPLFNNHLECGGYGRFTMIPGSGHISRPRTNDYEFFGARMSWMLSQTYGTPFNYVVRIRQGKIQKVVSGDRPFLGNDDHYGFFEAGTKIRLAAAAEQNGRAFVKWASVAGDFSDANATTTEFTTIDGDMTVRAIYECETPTLKVTGGSAQPATPEPGDVVTLTAEENGDKSFLRWLNDKRVDVAVPNSRMVKFVMPDHDVTFVAVRR